MSAHSFAIRPATLDDCGTILALVRELAEYEKLAHAVVADESHYREHLFGRRSVAESLIAERVSKPIGFALFFSTFSTFVGRPGIYLEDLYVRPEERGTGVGKALFAKVASIAAERNCGRLEWSVLNWNEPAIRFYESLGAKPLTEWTIYRLDGKALSSVAMRDSLRASSHGFAES